jgi:hypothetical protein
VQLRSWRLVRQTSAGRGWMECFSQLFKDITSGLPSEFTGEAMVRARNTTLALEPAA